MTTDILLANPLFLNQDEAERELMTPYFPLGLLYLAAYLRERDFSVEIFDGTFAEGESAFLEALEQHHPQVVGMTALQPTRGAALSLARKAHAFGATVVLGGPGGGHRRSPRRRGDAGRVAGCLGCAGRQPPGPARHSRAGLPRRGWGG